VLRYFFSDDSWGLRSAAALTTLLAACSAAPPCPPDLPTPVASASVAPSTSASASASATVIAFVQMQPPKDAAALGFCTKDQQQTAQDETEEIAKLARRLPRDASAADAVTERIGALFASPCYNRGNLARSLDTAKLKAARAWSVAKWWESGGQVFLKDALQHANAIHFAPSIPRMIAQELLPAGGPLGAILCPTFAAECDPVARGAALDLGRELVRVSLLHALPRGTSAPDENPSSPEGCAQALRKEPPDQRLLRYAACVDQLVPRRAALPEARYRSPKGWLVLRGRRGHYSFCDEARAYDLETGTAYIASRCGGLVLSSGGAVNQGATRDTGAMKSQVGTLSVDALRRLALMLWVESEVDDDAREYAKFPVPTGVPMPEPERGFGFGKRGWSHSGQTSIQFELSDGKSTLLAGKFVWPDSSDAGNQVIDDLVVSAETTFREGCPKVALPASLAPAKSLGGVSGIDASPDALRKNADDLSAAFAELRKTKVCKK
jgi:hypothetical protein